MSVDLTPDQRRAVEDEQRGSERHRNERLAANLAARQPMSRTELDDMMRLVRQYAAAFMDVPGPRAAQLADEIDRLRAQAEAVRKLHFATTIETTSGPRQMCNHCDTGDPYCTVSDDWPCPTIAALEGAS